MTTELQNKVWSILPKEFKEEVKRLWQSADKEQQLPHDAFLRGEYSMLVSLFGFHNLTSDAEGEDEMLYVSRKQIDALQGEIFKAIMDAHDADDWQDAAHYILDVMPRSFAAFFGSKCLPNETNLSENLTGSEPKPAEPKFKVGDTASYVCSPMLKHKCTVTKVMQNEHSGKWEYNVMFEWGGPGMWIPESDLEPYTEPTDLDKESSTCTNDCPSQCPSQNFDNILKDDFRDHNRLHIAAILAAGMLASEVRCYPVDRALELVDKLIAECKKGGDNA